MMTTGSNFKLKPVKCVLSFSLNNNNVIYICCLINVISTRVHNGAKSYHIGNLQIFFICKILSNMYTIYSTIELEKIQ